jgi:hypothetical protein
VRFEYSLEPSSKKLGLTRPNIEEDSELGERFAPGVAARTPPLRGGDGGVAATCGAFEIGSVETWWLLILADLLTSC